jgi:hypothetical protein
MTIALIERAATAAAAETDPESAIRALLAPLHSELGRRDGAFDLPEGVSQFFVAGAFVVTPDEEWHMLTGNIGFPAEQRRLMIPIDGGHPGRVRASREPLHLPDTAAEPGSFKQYLKTARMGSAIYAPMIWQGRFLGQIVMAGRASGTLSDVDFRVMCAVAPVAAANWVAHSGDQWLASTYPPEDAFCVTPEGL